MAGPADLLVNETDGFAVDFTYLVLPITGSLAVTETGADTAAIAAAVEAEGTLAATETGADVAEFTIGHASIVGSLAATETGADVAAFAMGHFLPEANWTLAARMDSTSLIGTRAISARLHGGM